MKNVGGVALTLEIEPHLAAACDLSAELDSSPEYLSDRTTELELYASRGRNPRGD
jgi:hypothetical protein